MTPEYPANRWSFNVSTTIIGFAAGFSVPTSPTITLTGAGYTGCTATAVGSLWLSHHPGTSSMGELLALSLACTLAAAVLFQPALMGRPRGAGDA